MSYRWKQCPYCARWFIAHGRQIYDTKKCQARYMYLLGRLEAKKEKERLK